MGLWHKGWPVLPFVPALAVSFLMDFHRRHIPHASHLQCRRRLPATTVLSVYNGTSGVFNGVELLPTSSGLFTGSSQCPGCA